jgi:hypothetical protein
MTLRNSLKGPGFSNSNRYSKIMGKVTTCVNEKEIPWKALT